jgi:hypothetical protein
LMIDAPSEVDPKILWELWISVIESEK